MKANVIAKDKEIEKVSGELYGDNRISYRAMSVGLAGKTKSYPADLKEATHTTVSYDVAEKFPEETLGEALKSTQTELAQVHAIHSQFSFHQFPWAVEFVMSNLSNAEVGNVMTGIAKQFLKQWDNHVFNGVGPNEGYLGHSRATQITGAALTFDELVTRTREALFNFKENMDITSSEYNRVTMAVDAAVNGVLETIEAGEQFSNREKFLKMFPGLSIVELPGNLLAAGGPGKALFVFRDVVTLHHASLPHVEGTESKNYGMAVGTLWAYESAGVEVEIQGGIQEVTFA